MKSKTIKQVLRKKFDEFLNTIEDEKVRVLVKNNSIITGGSIASMLKGEEVNDYDVYFTNRETVLAVCQYYIKKFYDGNKESRPQMMILEEPIGGFPPYVAPDKLTDQEMKENAERETKIDPNGRIKIRIKSAGVAAEDGFNFDEQEEQNTASLSNLPDDNTDSLLSEINPDETKKERKARRKLEKAERKKPYRPVYISANAITLSDQFQLIIRFYGDAEEIHSNYDFAHCTCQWTSKDGELVLPSEAVECLMTNELRYKGSKYPLASIIRSRKFINRGMTINAGQYLKMCLQLNDMDLRDLSVLEDQLIGVDAVYFAQMLASIPEDKKISNRIDSVYMMRMIDRFF